MDWTPDKGKLKAQNVTVSLGETLKSGFNKKMIIQESHERNQALGEGGVTYYIILWRYTDVPS